MAALDAWTYAASHAAEIGAAARTHLALAGSALLLAMVVAVPLGIRAARAPRLGGALMALAGALRVVPSLAVLVLVLPYLGLGFRSALVALTVLAIPPILVNTYAGYSGVDAGPIEAARGMGMTAREILLRIETPLALPVVVAGLRTAAVEVVASATLAAFIGGGGLGEFIVNGLGMSDWRALLAGAVPVALLALGAEAAFGLIERTVRRATA
ncbi:MAG TPA: ABC transporter permease [Thermodesulfobacteriota bacterium]